MHSLPSFVDHTSEFEPAPAARLSRHARTRAQQRAITAKCVPLVRAYGRREHDGRGAIRYVMTKDSIAAVEEVVGRSSRLERLAGVFVVISATDNTVITIGHRT
jgi:hypothetical protein